MKTGEISSTFKRFVLNYDSSLVNVNSMTLRASFATAMFRAFKSGQLFQEGGQEFFFDHIASIMNTSAEQMRSTYVAIDNQDFETSARTLMRAMQDVSQDGIDEIDGPHGTERSHTDTGSLHGNECPNNVFSFLNM